jgi:hypothetical protein
MIGALRCHHEISKAEQEPLRFQLQVHFVEPCGVGRRTRKKRCDITPAESAERIGISQNYLSTMERGNFEVNNLKPFSCLAFPHTTYLKTPFFGDELVTSFCSCAERKWFLHKAGLPDYWCNGVFSPIEGNSSAAFTSCATPKSSDAAGAGLTKFRRKETTAQITVPPQGP